jgi:hypothetical protein
MLLFRSGSGVCRSIVPATEKSSMNLSEWLPASAARTAARRVSGPASANERTVRLTCAGDRAVFKRFEPRPEGWRRTETPGWTSVPGGSEVSLPG